MSYDRLRFDFTYPKGMEKKEIAQVEELINQYIQKSSQVNTEIMDLDKAKNSGAVALFNEKYEQKVRVVNVDDYSKELCSGTHVKNTSEIKRFKIISESSIASGIRRIEAVTDSMVKRFEQEELKLAKEQREKLQQEKMLKEKKKKKGLEFLTSFKRTLKGLKSDSTGTINYLSQKLDNADLELLRKAVDLAKEKIKSGVLFFSSTYQNKVFMVCWVSDDLVKKGVDASLIIKKIAQVAGGSGGGRPNLAQAGGDNPKKLDEALTQLPGILKKVTLK